MFTLTSTPPLTPTPPQPSSYPLWLNFVCYVVLQMRYQEQQKLQKHQKAEIAEHCLGVADVKTVTGETVLCYWFDYRDHIWDSKRVHTSIYTYIITRLYGLYISLTLATRCCCLIKNTTSCSNHNLDLQYIKCSSVCFCLATELGTCMNGSREPMKQLWSLRGVHLTVHFIHPNLRVKL